MKNDTEFRSEEIKEIISTMPNRFLRYGNILFLCLSLMFIVLASFIKYPDIIKTPAVITTTIPVQKEYAQISAKLDAILVNENETVLINQPLAVLENSANFEDVFLLKSVVDSFDIQVGRVSSSLVNISNFSLGDVETAFNLFETSFRQYQLYKQLQPFDNEKIANSNVIHELNHQLIELRLQRDISNADLELKQTRLNRSQSLLDKGVISLTEHEQQQLEYSSNERALKILNISESQMIASINNAQKQSKVTFIDKTKEEFILFNRMLQSFQQLKKSISEWDMNYILRSKIDGQVIFHDFWAKHQTVNAGDLVFTIIPTKTSEFIVRLEAPVYNSAKIKIGQKVNLNLLDYPEIEFGYLVGEVISISSAPNIDGNYLVKVSLPQKLITTYNTEIIFKQEMRAEAEIITENSRLIEKVFYQFKSLFNR